MAMLEVEPIKLSDPDAGLKATRKETAALNRLADKRLLGSDTYRSSDALQRLVNTGGLDKQRLANIGSLRTKALGEGHTLPQFGSGLNEQIRQKEALRQAVAASGGIQKQAAAGRLSDDTVGRTAADAIQLPLGESLPPVVAAARESARTEGTEIQRTGKLPGGGYGKIKTTEKVKGPRREATPTVQRHLPDRTLSPEQIKSLNAHVAAAAFEMPGIITGNEKIIEIGQDERGTFFIIEVQGKDGRPRKFTIRPKGQTR
jgi:hypothetical protein